MSAATKRTARFLRRRSYLYLTRKLGEQLRVAVFRHPDFKTMTLPYQVPGGTIEPGETPEAGALREAFEESGLESFAEVRFLAQDVWYSDYEKVSRERYFYQLCVKGIVPETWNHTVSDGELDQGMVFSYRWLSLSEARDVTWHMGDYLHLLG